MSIREIVANAPFALGDGLFYLGTKSTILYAIDTVSGEVSVCQTGFSGTLECSGAANSQLSDSVIIFGRADYTIHAIDERTGEERWNITTGDYVSSAIGLPPGFSQRSQNATTASAVIDNSQSFVAGFDGSLQLIDSWSGLTLWSTVLPSPAVHVQRDLSTLEGFEKPASTLTGKFPLPTSSLLNANLFFKEQVLMIIGRSSHKVWVAEHNGQLFALEHSARPIASGIRDRIESILKINVASPTNFIPALPDSEQPSIEQTNSIYASFPPILAPDQCTEENPHMCLVGLHPLLCDSGEHMDPNGACLGFPLSEHVLICFLYLPISGMCRPDEVPLLPEPTKPAQQPFSLSRSWVAFVTWINRLTLRWLLGAASSLLLLGGIAMYARHFLFSLKPPMQAAESDVPLWKQKQQKRTAQNTPKKRSGQNPRASNAPKCVQRELVLLGCLCAFLTSFLIRSAKHEVKENDDSDDSVTADEDAENPVSATSPSVPSVPVDPKPDAEGRLSVGKLTVHTTCILGLGSSGTVVYEGFLNGRKVAVKRMLKAFYSTADVETKLLIESDEHPNVVRYYATEDDSQFVYLALSHAEKTLDQLLEPKESEPPCNVPESHRQDILRQVVQGVLHLHALSIVHRDLKPQNILVSAARSPSAQRAWIVKISDMGLAKKLEQERASFSTTAARGTIGWQPPEILGDKTRAGGLKMTKKVDIFALGCIFYYVLTGKHPFGDRIEREVNIMSGKVYPLEGIDADANDLISRMIAADPSERPEAAEILTHPYVSSLISSKTFLCY